MPIKVLIVDDSKLVRQILTEVLTQFPDIEVVGAADGPFEAREMIKELKPDVLTLDVEMPQMDGITFLKNLMRLRPMPVVMLSTLTEKGADITLQALELGAVDFIAKPKSETLMGNLSAFNNALYNKIKFAARVRIQSKTPNTGKQVPFKGDASQCQKTLIAMGASTGGTEALRDVLMTMPANSPAVVITQHIPENFSRRFAKRLDGRCNMTIQEASQDLEIKHGNVYIARGGLHLQVKLKGNKLVCHLDDSEPVNRHKPSVDVMFESLIKLNDFKIYSVLLTGMGADGAKGMLSLKQHGHYSLIQDEQSSLIWGMPGKAFELNAHCVQSSLENVSETLLNRISQGMTRTPRSRNVSAKA